MNENLINNMRLPRITSIGSVLFGMEWAEKFHKCHSNELLHVVRGAYTLRLENGCTFTGKSGETFLMSAETCHRDLFTEDEDLEIFFVTFRWENAKDFFAEVPPDIFQSATENIRSEVKLIFDLMRINGSGSEPDKLVSETRLAQILALAYMAVCGKKNIIHPNDPQNPAVRREKLITEAKRYIRHHFREQISLDDLADHLKMSSFYISRLLSKNTELSFFEYLTELRIKEAKKLLLTGTWNVSELAEYLGYDNGNYFAKVFKKHVGVPPSQYGKAILTKPYPE